jgi:hypothetical protein
MKETKLNQKEEVKVEENLEVKVEVNLEVKGEVGLEMIKMEVLGKIAHLVEIRNKMVAHFNMLIITSL